MHIFKTFLTKIRTSFACCTRTIFLSVFFTAVYLVEQLGITDNLYTKQGNSSISAISYLILFFQKQSDWYQGPSKLVVGSSE